MGSQEVNIPSWMFVRKETQTEYLSKCRKRHFININLILKTLARAKFQQLGEHRLINIMKSRSH